MKLKKILLLGGGHAHVLLLHAWKKHRPNRDYEIVLISESKEVLYTGMLPGWIAGHYNSEDLSISLEKLCRSAGVVFRQAQISAINPNAREVVTNRGKFSYALASLNLGIKCRMPANLSAGEHDIPLKPTHSLPHSIEKFLKVCHADDTEFNVVIVGGGAGGVEVACALAWRLRYRWNVSISLVCRTFLPEHGRKVRDSVRDTLKIADVSLLEGFDVTKRKKETLVERRGEEISARYVLWSTPGVATSFLRSSRLQLDAAGFVEVDAYLRSLSHPDVFAAGDIASLTAQPVAKAGVYAVRQAPYLAENLKRCADNRKDLKAYRPQRHFLTILSLGEKKALAQKLSRVLGVGFSFILRGRMIWHWKDYLDRSFVKKFQR